MPYSLSVRGIRFAFRHWFEFACIYKDVFLFKEYDFTASNNRPVIIDCGSHIGVSVLYFARKYPHASITAFEPNPETFSLLKANVSANATARIRLLNKAVDRKNGTITFYIPKKRSSYSWGDTAHPDASDLETYRRIAVPAVRLSSFVTGPVDFLKLDVEGSEFAVLADLRPKLRRISQIVLEMHTKGKNRTEAYAAIESLLSKTHRIVSLREVGPLTSRRISRDALKSAMSEYYLIRAVARSGTPTMRQAPKKR